MAAISEHTDNMLLRNIENPDIFSLIEQFQFGELHFKRDEKTGLHTIIAIHNTKLGPALGGCRCIEYPNTIAALRDVMRLAQAMSYKAALAHLPLGGGKSVILRPRVINDREAYFKAFGRYVNDLGGRYIAAMDSGTSEADMNIIARETNFIASNTRQGHSGNPAPYTAHGVLLGIQACVRHHFKRDDLQGLHIVLQGVGQVGYALAKLLHERGARLSVCDINEKAVQRCVEEFNATAITIEESITTQCDVFAPCALGGVINDKTINQLNAPIIAGCANNVLEKPQHGQLLFDKGILYAPDYLINAGGLIYACSLYYNYSDQQTEDKLQKIYQRLLEVFARSDEERKPTSTIADTLAKELLDLN